MLLKPLEQFEIKLLIPIKFFGYDISITNSTISMLIAILCPILILSVGIRNGKLIPSRLQVLIESIYNFHLNMVRENIGPVGKKFLSLILTLFIFITSCNLLGIIPYNFTSTSHIIVTFGLSFLVFLTIIVHGFLKQGVKFLSIFCPEGVPKILSPLIILIEFFAFLARPISLSLRLAANMSAGHILIEIVAVFAASVFFLFKPIPIITEIILIAFEVFVSLLQAYIFTVLSCVYLSDAVKLH